MPDALSIERGAVDTYRVELADVRLAPGLYSCHVAAWRCAGDGQEELLGGGRVVLHGEVVPAADGGAATSWRAASSPIRFSEPLIERVADGAPPRAVR